MSKLSIQEIVGSCKYVWRIKGEIHNIKTKFHNLMVWFPVDVTGTWLSQNNHSQQEGHTYKSWFHDLCIKFLSPRWRCQDILYHTESNPIRWSWRQYILWFWCCVKIATLGRALYHDGLWHSVFWLSQVWNRRAPSSISPLLTKEDPRCHPTLIFFPRILYIPKFLSSWSNL